MVGNTKRKVTSLKVLFPSSVDHLYWKADDTSFEDFRNWAMRVKTVKDFINSFQDRR